MVSAHQARLALFLTSFHPGGTERQMTELIRRLDRERFDVRVACLHKEGAWLDRVETSVNEVAEFPLTGFARPSAVRAIRGFARWCRARDIQVVQTCDFYANVVGLAGAALAKTPVRLASRRELNPDKSRGQVLLQRLAYRAAHRVVANSPAAARQLAAEGVAAEAVRVIPNGLDFSPVTALARPGPITTLITVANLRPEKNHDVLLQAFALLEPDRSDLRLRIVGDGPRRSALEQQARELGIDRRVEFMGHREDVAALLTSSDLFVLPSRSEAFPNGALEAMAAGLPVVASAVGGLLDLIEDGSTGLLVPPGDAAALAQAIARLVAQPTLAGSLGSSARHYVRDRYSFDRMVTSFEHLYLTELHARLPVSTSRPAVTVS